ncbi:hypothetical protein NKG05_11255 [Oerskovia sp. M15]
MYDDEGGRGGLKNGESFVILGDQNADPHDGDSVDSAITQLLDNRRITDPLPTSKGAVEAAALQGREHHARLRPSLDTADFADTAPATSEPTTCSPRRASGSERRRLLADPGRPAVAPHRGLPVPEQRPPPRVG